MPDRRPDGPELQTLREDNRVAKLFASTCIYQFDFVVFPPETGAFAFSKRLMNVSSLDQHRSVVEVEHLSGRRVQLKNHPEREQAAVCTVDVPPACSTHSQFGTAKGPGDAIPQAGMVDDSGIVQVIPIKHFMESLRHVEFDLAQTPRIIIPRPLCSRERFSPRIFVDPPPITSVVPCGREIAHRRGRGD